MNRAATTTLSITHLDDLFENLTAETIPGAINDHLDALDSGQREIRDAALIRVHPLIRRATKIAAENFRGEAISDYQRLALDLILRADSILDQLDITDPLLTAALPKPRAQAALILDTAALATIAQRTWTPGQLAADILPFYRIGATQEVGVLTSIVAYASGSNHIYRGNITPGDRTVTLTAL